LDGRPAIAAVRERYIGSTEFSNLPRKYKTSISGCRHMCTNPELNDVAFVGVRHPELGAGFDLWVGGGLSTNPMFAKRLGAFVGPDEVAEAWAGVTGLFREYGYRRSRNHARFKFLVADWGAERVREVLQKEFLGRDLPDGPPPPPSAIALPYHVGVHQQRDGRAFVGFSLRAGRISGHQLRLVADLAERHGSSSGRVTPQPKMGSVDGEPA